MKLGFTLEEKTISFLDYIFPSLDTLLKTPNVPYETNNIVTRNIALFGAMGHGKTELVRSLAEQAVNRYGEDKTDAMVSEDGDLDSILDSFSFKPIQIVFLDNFTLRNPSKETVRAYFRIRHLWYRKFKRRYPNRKPVGYILAIFGIHRYHSSLPEFRTNIDALIARSTSLNPYDKQVLKSILGKDGFNDLLYIEANRDHHPILKSYSVFATKIDKGLLYLPLAKKNYLIEIPKKHNVEPYNIKIEKLVRNLFLPI